jgi:flagellar FliL protein
MTVTAMAPKQAAKGAAPDGAEEDTKKGSKKKKLIIGLVLLLALGGAGYWFFLKPSGPPPEPEPGEVLKIESIQVNLEGGHYLKIGLALQMTAGAHEADGSMALDAAISLFSGKAMAELARTEDRDKLKVELEKELDHLYHGDVMDVYFTDFVTQ